MLEVTLEANGSADLMDLLVALDEFEESGDARSVDLKFRAVQQPGSLVGSGMTEIVQLILALGTSGAIAAVVTIAQRYFDTHPRASLKVVVTEGDRKENVEATNIDAKTVKSFLEKYQPKK